MKLLCDKCNNLFEIKIRTKIKDSTYFRCPNCKTKIYLVNQEPGTPEASNAENRKKASKKKKPFNPSSINARYKFYKFRRFMFKYSIIALLLTLTGYILGTVFFDKTRYGQTCRLCDVTLHSHDVSYDCTEVWLNDKGIVCCFKDMSMMEFEHKELLTLIENKPISLRNIAFKSKFHWKRLCAKSNYLCKKYKDFLISRYREWSKPDKKKP